MDEETTTTTPDPDEPKGLRKQLADAHAKLKEYEVKEMGSAFESLKLDTDKGLGKAIAKEYNGEMTVDAIAKYAKDEYGYEVPTDEAPHPQAEDIATNQQALDQIGQTAGSVVAPSDQDKLAEAEATGDVKTSLALKGQEVASWFDGGVRR